MDQSIDIKKFNDGDHREFTCIYNKYYQRLYFFARNMVNDDQEAQDIVVESFTRLFERHTDFSAEAPIKSFLYVTARNRCLNYLRRKKIRDRVEKEIAPGFEVEQEAVAEAKMIEAELAKLLSGRVDRLPTQCRKVYELHRKGLSNEEISRKLGISKGNVSSQLVIANARLFGPRKKE